MDAFYHRYTYDAENRLILAETSQDSVYWDKEARYEYYKHGPLARVVIGDKMVQGLDYAYTLQGWLKGVNSNSLLPAYDMGRDGDTSHQNRYIGRDAFGFSLNYYAGDYSPIGTGVNPFPGSSAFLNNAYRPFSMITERSEGYERGLNSVETEVLSAVWASISGSCIGPLRGEPAIPVIGGSRWSTATGMTS